MLVQVPSTVVSWTTANYKLPKSNGSMLPYTIRVALKVPRRLLRAYTEAFIAFSGHAQLRGTGLFESIHSHTLAQNPAAATAQVCTICTSNRSKNMAYCHEHGPFLCPVFNHLILAVFAVRG